MKEQPLKKYFVNDSAARAIGCAPVTLRKKFEAGTLRPCALLITGIGKNPAPLIGEDRISEIQQLLLKPTA